MTTPEREKFEKWIKGQGCDISMTDCNNQIYMSRAVQGCWLAWQAALSAAPTPPVCQMCNGHGLIGGFVSTESGYHSEPCPDCNTPPDVAAPEFTVWWQRFLMDHGAWRFTCEEAAQAAFNAHKPEMEVLRIVADTLGDINRRLQRENAAIKAAPPPEVEPVYQARWNEVARWNDVSLEYYLRGPAPFKRKLHIKTEEDISMKPVLWIDEDNLKAALSQGEGGALRYIMPFKERDNDIALYTSPPSPKAEEVERKVRYDVEPEGQLLPDGRKVVAWLGWPIGVDRFHLDIIYDGATRIEDKYDYRPIYGGPPIKADYDAEGNPLNLMAAARDAFDLMDSSDAFDEPEELAVIDALRKFTEEGS